MAGLPPPPINDKPGSFTWLEWYRQLRNYVSTSGSVPWYIINFSGSNITDIALREHNNLQGVQGGAAGENYHLSLADHANLVSDTPKFKSITLGAAAGDGIMVDTVNPTYGWKDLIGDVSPKSTGVGSPALTSFRNDIRWFAYAAADDGDIIFHIPHDYAPGTDLFIHAHWSHVGTNITGDMDIRFHATYAKGHQQANFPADVEPHITRTGLTIAAVPQYHHVVDEIQLSSSTPSGTQLDTALIEPDGLLLIHYDFDVIPTITGGTSNKVFLFAIDLHYQATNTTTKNKSPNFYG